MINKPMAVAMTAALCITVVPGAARLARAAPGVTPEVRVKSARVVGDTTTSAVLRRTVASGKAALLSCYQRNLKKHLGEVGELALSVRVETTGKATAIKVVRSGVNAALRKCVFKTIRGWRFAGWKAPVRQLATLELIFQLAGKRPKAASVRGGVPERLVAGTLLARLPSLLGLCLKGAVIKRRRWPPKLTIIVDFDGTVQTTSVSGRLPARSMRKCITDRVALWDFPPPDNGHRTWIYWPLRSSRPRPASPRRSHGR